MGEALDVLLFVSLVDAVENGRVVGLKSLPYGPRFQAVGSCVVEAGGAGWQQA